MSNPKTDRADKAKELVDKFYVHLDLKFTEDGKIKQYAKAKFFAIICVDEIINYMDSEKLWNCAADWEQVKEQIKKL